jgi:hypothetical protein
MGIDLAPSIGAPARCDHNGKVAAWFRGGRRPYPIPLAGEKAIFSILAERRVLSMSKGEERSER